MSRRTISLSATMLVLAAAFFSAGLLRAENIAPPNTDIPANRLVAKTITFRFVPLYTHADLAPAPRSAVLRSRTTATKAAQASQSTSELPAIADFSLAPSELWHLRPAVRQANREPMFVEQ